MQQLEFEKTNGWGGKRRGAGRKNRSGTPNHMARAKVDLKKPLHITQRLAPGWPSLRCPRVHKAFQRALRRTQAFDTHVLHYALLGNHLHMLVEARNNETLGRGMRSLFISLAKQIKKMQNSKGPVFHGRYHLQVICTPAQMKNALRYVLLNAAKHSGWIAHLDPYSSARYFPHWVKLIGRQMNAVLKAEVCGSLRTGLDEIGLSPPRSWLATHGWQRAHS